MHFTGAVLQANVGDDPELVDRKVAPALEVVTHSCLTFPWRKIGLVT